MKNIHGYQIANYKWLHVIAISLFLLVTGAQSLSAGLIPAWTRKLTLASWTSLTQRTIFRTTQKAPFIRFLRKDKATTVIKSTDKKFIYHHAHYSGVFSKAEKELLLKHVYPQATLGKVAYLHDKHAAFFSTIIEKDIAAVSETAFLKHQARLEQMLVRLENHYLKSNREKYASDIFSVDEIARLQTQGQPPSYLLNVRELNSFAELSSLAAQKEWVAGKIRYIEQNLQELLAKDTFTLKPIEFESYYVQNMRLEYFRSLADVLERANKKRPSAIIRYKRPLPIPGETTLLTDAQRAGYLQFMADTTHDPAFDKYIHQFNADYGPYAVAEALEVSYEVPLLLYMHAPELLGVEEGARLRKLGYSSCLAELTPKIIKLDAQLADLRKSTSLTPEFYVSYYRIYARQQIYKTLVALARAMIELENFRR